MNTRKILAAFAAAATLLIGGAAFADPTPDPGAKEERAAEREAELYEDGTDYIDEEQWDKAIKAFGKVVELKGSRADGALYWMSYALAKSGRRSEALQTVEALKKSYPKSKWLDDAQALALEARQARGERVQPEGLDDDELKAMAINSLMHTDPEKAYPILEKIVRGPSNKKTKERALFILAQSESPRAQALIADIARGKANPDLQKDAVKYIGIHGGTRNGAVLSELYTSGATREVKKEVLRAFMISGDEQRVFAAAKSEKDVELRKEAIHLLGVMGGREELAQMYASETSRDVKEEIIQGLFISGDDDRMSDLARNEKDPQLRREAIRKLGLMGGSAATLLSLYNSDPTVDGKEAVIDALFLSGNARALIDIAKKEKNQQLRKEALQKLSIMDDDDALAYMLQILED
jgi:HEAT repeat protein